VLHAFAVEGETERNSMAQRQVRETPDASRLPQEQRNGSSEEKTPLYRKPELNTANLSFLEQLCRKKARLN
jgi:hypothetical protein